MSQSTPVCSLFCSKCKRESAKSLRHHDRDHARNYLDVAVLSTARVCAQCNELLKPEYPYAVCERCDMQNRVELDDDCDVCDRCGGDGFIEYLDAGPSEWGEDCPSERLDFTLDSTPEAE